MAFTSIGDLAQSMSMRRHNADLRANFQKLTQEIATGQKSDVGAAVQGGFRPLAGLEASITRLSGYAQASQQAVLLTDGLQAVLEQVNAQSSQIAPRLLSGANSGNTELLTASSQSAVVAIESVVSSLNTQIAGRTLLSGNAIDTPPLSPASEIIGAAKLAIAGLATTTDIEAALTTFFETGGAFETDHFHGSATPASPLAIGEEVFVQEPMTALNDDIKATLKGLIMASLVADGSNNLATSERASLAATAAETLIEANTGLIKEQGRVGANQAALDERLTQISAETHAVEMARSAIVAIDPYEAATELQNIESSLELLYTMTARLSRLNLSDFLR